MTSLWCFGYDKRFIKYVCSNKEEIKQYGRLYGHGDCDLSMTIMLASDLWVVKGPDKIISHYVKQFKCCEENLKEHFFFVTFLSMMCAEYLSETALVSMFLDVNKDYDIHSQILEAGIEHNDAETIHDIMVEVANMPRFEAKEPKFKVLERINDCCIACIASLLATWELSRLDLCNNRSITQSIFEVLGKKLEICPNNHLAICRNSAHIALKYREIKCANDCVGCRLYVLGPVDTQTSEPEAENNQGESQPSSLVGENDNRSDDDDLWSKFLSMEIFRTFPIENVRTSIEKGDELTVNTYLYNHLVLHGGFGQEKDGRFASKGDIKVVTLELEGIKKKIDKFTIPEESATTSVLKSLTLKINELSTALLSVPAGQPRVISDQVIHPIIAEAQEERSIPNAEGSLGWGLSEDD